MGARQLWGAESWYRLHTHIYDIETCSQPRYFPPYDRYELIPCESIWESGHAEVTELAQRMQRELAASLALISKERLAAKNKLTARQRFAVLQRLGLSTSSSTAKSQHINSIPRSQYMLGTSSITKRKHRDYSHSRYSGR